MKSRGIAQGLLGLLFCPILLIAILIAIGLFVFDLMAGGWKELRKVMQ